MKEIFIPENILKIYETIREAGFEAYFVGGCVRDIFLERKPADWDITTKATPQEIQKIFKKSFYDNKFGTVKVAAGPKTFLEITTYRSEAKYTDKRHPDKIKWAEKLEEDLSRRDFTINAMALAISGKSLRQPADSKFTIIDYFKGQEDLKKKIIRAVGNPEERFREDALRLLRAIRFAAQLNFKIEEKTYQAIKENSELIKFISKERIRDELIKIIASSQPYSAFLQLQETGLLKHIIPELEEGKGVLQGRHHKFDVLEHSLRSLQAAAERNYNLEVRLAALLHDIAKPRTRDYDASGQATFYNHQVLGKKIAQDILQRLRFDKRTVKKVSLLVREHMFTYDIGKVTESGVRRLLRKVGKENISDLINLRIADRLGSGVPKAVPYRLRHLIYMLEKVSKDPISVKMLKINGNDLMEILKIEPGPRIGLLLNALLVKVLDKPELNEKDRLKRELVVLNKLSNEELKAFEKDLDYKKKEEDIEIRKKYYLKEED